MDGPEGTARAADMIPPVQLQTLSDAKRQFINGAEALGATSPSHARRGAELPRISARELGELLDTGIVREGPPGSYYIYGRSKLVAPLEPLLRKSPDRSRKLVLALVFWFIVIAIPVLFLFLAR